MINLYIERILNILSTKINNQNNIVVKSFRKSKFKSLIYFMKSIYNSLISNLYIYLLNIRMNLVLNINLFCNLTTEIKPNIINYTFLYVITYFQYKLPNNSIYYINCGVQHNNLFFNIIYFYLYISYLLFCSLYTLNMSMVSLPKRIKLFTLLKSPHTDKKSREQFKLLMNSALILDPYNICNYLFRQLSMLHLKSCLCKNTETLIVS